MLSAHIFYTKLIYIYIYIYYSFNDPTIDYLDDYDDQSILAASFEYQNTGFPSHL